MWKYAEGGESQKERRTSGRGKYRQPHSGHRNRAATKEQNREREGRNLQVPGASSCRRALWFTAQPKRLPLCLARDTGPIHRWKGRQVFQPNTVCLGDTEIPNAPRRSVRSCPSLPAGNPGRGGPPFTAVSRGRDGVMKPGGLYLLLQPGAMAPSPLNPETSAPDTLTSNRARRRDSARSRWPQI